MWNTHDLIVAPATASGLGGRSIVRLAGDELQTLLDQMFVIQALPGPGAATRRVGFGHFGEAARVVQAELSPQGLGWQWGQLAVNILHWPGPAGPTGGPLAEVQLPGSPLLAAALVKEACRQGARLARGGEFSLRSFLAGRLDLLQAEAVLAVVDARSPAELSIALDRMAGGVGRDLHSARETLLDLLADLEAGIDFADEHTPARAPGESAGIWATLEKRIAITIIAIEEVAARLESRDTVATGTLPRVVLVGKPNIGKSSLLNALLSRDVALVADESGTTRDWLEAPLSDGTTACILVDLAGLETLPRAEQLTHDEWMASQALQRARDEIARADVIVLCRDAVEAQDCADKESHAAFMQAALGHQIPLPRAQIYAITRIDRVFQPAAFNVDALPDASGQSAIATSSPERIGIEQLRKAIFRAVAQLPASGSSATLRMAVGIEQALESLVRAKSHAASGPDEQNNDEAIVASFLARGVEFLGEVTGVEIGNDILDRLFSRHCIGK